MIYNFDQEIDRRGSNSAKWGVVPQNGRFVPLEAAPQFLEGKRLLPMWVADMDFLVPQPVIDALVQRAQHGIFGYNGAGLSYRQAVVDWMARRHGWAVDADWIVATPGVVPALYLLVRTFVAPGQRVIIQPPVYHPFFTAASNNEVEAAHNPLLLADGRYEMDFAGLEALARQPDTAMLILCSPHNPVGRVWMPEELRRLGEICLEHGVLVVADEIHGDLIYPGHRFTSFGTLGEALAQNAIVCTAPSKTFNLAGLAASNIIIPNPELRLRFERTLNSTGLHGVNTFGMVALEAAYTHGEEWLTQVMDYIAGNLRYLRDFVAEHLPQIEVIEPEGTYLVWLDCRGLGLGKAELERLMLDEARVFMNEGYIFGREGEGFERINIACPRSILAEALQQIKEAVQGLADVH
ncbi:MAG: MalY/PatB family protein [Anaerolineae bacterium]